MKSDDDLIQSIKQGRKQYFEVLIDRYKTPILNFIYKMIYDYDEAQNLSQEVFITVFKTLPRYRMEGNFQAYIFTIAKNLTLNQIKKNQRTVNISSLLSKNASDRYFQHQDTQFSQLEQEGKERQLIAALKELKENQRIALILKVYLGFSYKQISEITGWSIPKVETLIFRAKSQLKTKIFMQENNNQNVKKVR
jgi:RNA polymerase sigma-70 factor (ECF subfamily)